MDFCMKKLFIILLFIFTYSDLRSLELTISCIWNEKIFFDKNKKKTKDEKILEKEFFYINTDFEFFGDPRSYGSLSDTNNEFNRYDRFEFTKDTFLKFSDLSGGKKTHYFTTKYERESGKISDEFINRNPNFGKVQSIKKQGNCREVVFHKCENEKVLLCLGNYINFNKMTKEVIKYDKEKKYFFCAKKKILSEKPYLEYQKIFPDQLDRNRYEEINSNYIVKFYNSEGYNYKFIKLGKNNYKIKESVDLPRVNITYSGKCKSINNN